jgi:hypothetical protein
MRQLIVVDHISELFHKTTVPMLKDDLKHIDHGTIKETAHIFGHIFSTMSFHSFSAYSTYYV